MAAIFFPSNLYLKQGICSVYVMVDFICKGCLELPEKRIERDLLSTVRFEPGTFRLRSEGATTELRRLISVPWIKVHLLLTVNLPVAHGTCRYNKIICRVFLLCNIFIVLLMNQLQKFADCKEFTKCNLRQIIVLYLPCAAGKFLKITQLKPDELLSNRQTSVFVAQW